MVNQGVAHLEELLNSKILPTRSLEDRKNRQAALQKFQFPNKTNEDWRYTSIKSLMDFEVKNAEGKVFEDILNPAHTRDCAEIVFVNGFFSEKLSKMAMLYPNVKITTYDQAVSKGSVQFDSSETYFRSLNQAFFENGVYIEIGREVQLNTPIIIRHLVNIKSKMFMASPRVCVRALPFSSVDIIEIFEDGSAGSYFTNDVCDLEIYANSRVNHLRILNESPASIHTGHFRASLYRDSSLCSTILNTGSKSQRTQIEAFLFEPGASARLNGLGLLSGDRKTELNISIQHLAPNTVSVQDYKNILSGKSHAVFQGKVKIEKQAQQSNSQQINRNLLLGEKSHVDTKPQLDVYADDVKATHGATVGQLSSEELFYLQSRGFSPKDAYNMICRGFAMSLLEKIENKWIYRNVQSWLEGSVSSYVDGD